MNCADSLQCPTVLAKQNGNILWQEHRLPDDSLSKTFSVTKRAWSPHNHYIALISGAYDNEIVVFDFIKNDVIRVYEDSNSQNIFEVVWVD